MQGDLDHAVDLRNDLGEVHGLRAEAVLEEITLSGARSRLDRRQFSRPNTHLFSSSFKIYANIIFSLAKIANFCKMFVKHLHFSQKFTILSELSEIFKKIKNVCGMFYSTLQNFVDFDKINAEKFYIGCKILRRFS